MITLNQRSKTPLYEQLYEQFRDGILEGVYPTASRLPSIRALAESLHCSRNTVEAAYRLLAQEGFIESRPGSGFVVMPLPLEPRFEDVRVVGDVGRTRDVGGSDSVNFAVQSFADAKRRCPLVQPRYDFTYGNLEPGTFPSLEWKALTDDILLSIDATKADAYTDSAGEEALRREIARILSQSRNVKAHPEQIIIQGGTQASLQNLLGLFDPQNDVVGMEDPGYDGARSVFERSHFTVCPLPTYPYDFERYFSDIEQSSARLVYLTPSNQFPLGYVLPKEARYRLIEWAAKNDAYLIEDDYCSEFNYRERPLAAMQSLDNEGRVIYMGTFSKSLSPALRMNYLVLPPALLATWREVYWNSYPAVAWLGQEALARYLADDRRARQLRRLHVRCRRKYELLTGALRKTMGNRVEIIEGGAGLHLLVNVLDGRSQGELIARARAAGVRVYETDRYWMAEDHPLKSCVLMGFSAIALDEIEAGVEALARAWFG